MQHYNSADRFDALQPWQSLVVSSYWEIPDDFSHGLDLFERAVREWPDNPAIEYFDASISYKQLDEMSDAVATAIVAGGFQPGDRLAVYMQNIPAFSISMLAAWKAGGSLVPINPMNKARELALILNDARPQCLILEPDLFEECFRDLAEADFRPAQVLLASPYDYQSSDDDRVLPARRTTSEAPSFSEAVADYTGADFPVGAQSPDDVALLVYTSGTTGVPKAAVITHAAVGRASAYAMRAYGLEFGQPVLAVAPVFHTTGLMSTLMTTLYLGSALVMTYRFHPVVMVEAIRKHRPVFTAASPTAYIALTQADGVQSSDFECFKACAIGGAAVSPALVQRLKAEFGVPAQTGYGMTETGGAVSITPLELRASTPTDPATGALSVGIPLPGVEIWIADDEGNRLPAGEIGEFIVCAPTSMTHYWDRKEATQETLRGDGLRTGDVGFMDTDGWFYLVDRKKDMIVASGYKVWPREVEDVLYAHPAVLEVAVVGVADKYRGETVRAYIRKRPNHDATLDDISAYCSQTMAAYKRPREIIFVDDLPKTASGKIQRAALRDAAAA